MKKIASSVALMLLFILLKTSSSAQAKFDTSKSDLSKWAGALPESIKSVKGNRMEIKTGYEYTIENNTVVISPKPSTTTRMRGAMTVACTCSKNGDCQINPLSPGSVECRNDGCDGSCHFLVISGEKPKNSQKSDTVK